MHNAPLTAISFSFRSHGLLDRTGIFRLPASQMSSCSVLTHTATRHRKAGTIEKLLFMRHPVTLQLGGAHRHVSVNATFYPSGLPRHSPLYQYLMTIKRLLPCAKALADSRNKSQFQKKKKKQDTQGGFLLCFTTSDRKRGRSGRLNRHSTRCPLVAIRAIKPCDIAYERVYHQP